MRADEEYYEIEKGEDILTKYSLSGLVSAMKISDYKLMTGKELRSSTFGIKKLGEWVVRVDRPHAGYEYNHLNINPKISGYKDPHYRLPAGAADFGATATSVLETLGMIATISAVGYDSYCIGKAAVEDFNRQGSLGEHAAKETACVASKWIGGAAGGYTGAKVGGAIGAVLCAPVGGSALCAMAGSLLGGGYGGVKGGAAACRFVQDNMSGGKE